MPRTNCREKVRLRGYPGPHGSLPRRTCIWACYLPEVPYDRGVCPRVLCVEAQLAILESDEGERLVKPPARQETGDVGAGAGPAEATQEARLYLL